MDEEQGCGQHIYVVRDWYVQNLMVVCIVTLISTQQTN